MAETADVVVVGGGSTGTSIAWQLAKMGAGRVVLLERRGLAAQATGVTAGIVRTHYTHETLARMALRARHVFENFDDVVGGDAGFRQTGFLALLGPDDVETVAANVAMHRDLGINTHILSPDEIRAVEPRLALFGIGAAAWEPESGYADPVRTTLSFADAARRHGAELRIGVGADSLEADAKWDSGGRDEHRTHSHTLRGRRQRFLCTRLGSAPRHRSSSHTDTAHGSVHAACRLLRQNSPDHLRPRTRELLPAPRGRSDYGRQDRAV